MGPRVPVDNLGFLVMDGFLFHIIFPFFLSFFFYFFYSSVATCYSFIYISKRRGGPPENERGWLAGYLCGATVRSIVGGLSVCECVSALLGMRGFDSYVGPFSGLCRRIFFVA